ncbi:ubiquinone biosynthesis monooxygenase Coq7 [Noviherbaspirillum humi]|uniref:3-demethoxyubiquinol 3-hydroxylase n=1 Tax=Noviherbaspirillum humi TaxID=1688639 RepID=A0A239L8D9_9BURK|nr:2-polyprenyl-3-methyl-6-methoxy-1,4-benzoquinone monooxygenase [Noviherbaspirillum humi]SNT26731.1 ubiquinone biosynthesis monooxygenase Coq7 [Noviherbaspirillum humi]
MLGLLNSDHFIEAFDKALRVISGNAVAHRPTPGRGTAEAPLSDEAKRRSAGLMRVNHVGEVCAQALYDSQAQFAQSPATRVQFKLAGREEEDHLAWTAERLEELGSRPSLLNPVWYAGSFLLGTIAARAGDAYSLGFVVETERQVEAHLMSHLDRLPAADAKSRAIVEQMRMDEIEHGNAAKRMGANTLPWPVRKGMQLTAKIMTTTAYYI